MAGIIFVQLDAEYDSDDRLIEAGPLAELLYVRSLAFAKRKMSDGKVTRSQLAIVGRAIPDVLDHAAALVRTGAWEETDAGWCVAAWLKRNKSAAAIEATRAAKKAASTKANHERWHISDAGKPALSCVLCYPIADVKPDASTDAKSDVPASVPDSVTDSTDTETDTQEETETEADTKAEAATRTPPTDQVPRKRLPAADALEMLIVQKVKDKQPNDAIAYRRSFESELREEMRQPLAEYLDLRPHATAEELAAYVLNVRGLTVAQSEPKRPWYANPNCECEGDGLTNLAAEGMPASYGPCPCRRPDPYPTLTLVPPPPDDTPPAFKPREETAS